MIKNTYRLLSLEERKMIDVATMEVLAESGIMILDKEARSIYKEAGCIVDEKTNMVKIPEYVVRKALSCAPTGFKLYGRNKKRTTDIRYGGETTFNNFGVGVKMCDYVAPGKYHTRNSTESDIANIAKVVDYADKIDFYLSAVAAGDLTGVKAQNIHEQITPVFNTSKNILVDAVGPFMPIYFEVIKTFYGGDEEEARKKPIYSMTGCPTSPLEIGTNFCQVIISAARYNMPCNVLSMAMSGGSSPVHLAGTIVTHNAEVLAGITLSQLTVPGAPVWYGSSTTAFDLRRGTAPVGAPEIGLISAAVVEMGEYYNLPTYVAGF